jgi:acyl-CoA-binding protein
MPDLQRQFIGAVAESAQLREPPDLDTQLQLYALYKQGTCGDAGGERPEVGDLIARAKYDAWARIAGLSREKAMQQYIEFVFLLKE